MIKSANLGFPRIGAQRELKKVVEAFWKGDINKNQLLLEAEKIKKNNWLLQKNASIDYIPSNDFSFYDQVLDHICLFGAVPERYEFTGDVVDIETYFAMARGSQSGSRDVRAMEMTKWFDTNYHYMVPELNAQQNFQLSSDKPVAEYLEAKKLGVETRPVLIGPVTFLKLAKTTDNSDAIDLLDSILPLYEEVIKKLINAGAKAIQIDEPYLITDLDKKTQNAYKDAYDGLKDSLKGCEFHLTTYFDGLRDNSRLAFSLGADVVHVDLKRYNKQFEEVVNLAQKNNTKLSLGLVDGRNIWINDILESINIAKEAIAHLGKENVIIAPSCSLLHSPVDLEQENKIDDEIKSWLCFAKQKLDEVKAIANLDVNSKIAIKNKEAIIARKKSARVHIPFVKEEVENITDAMMMRENPHDVRKESQNALFNLPKLPTTTIGSFPQTKEIRKKRAEFKQGLIGENEYNNFLQEETKKCIKWQEEIGIDVLVHGEYERNDMVEYFGEQLQGFIFSSYGWVQSYGSRCVKPPIIFGDINREKPMTVKWTKYAKDLTSLPVKGMLTGPVTMLQWSFVRDDCSRMEVCKQLALSIRKEVIDLEKAGIKFIQIDEPAYREGLPLRKADRDEYLNWATACFRISASGVEDSTQIHTHMCYSEFNDIIKNIADMDADVISIETSRSNMELLSAFVDFKYPNDIGPGIYDIHSPRVPSQEEMEKLLNKATKLLKEDQIWVNPDCGLKTRDWPETKNALQLMVKTAHKLRQENKKKVA